MLWICLSVLAAMSALGQPGRPDPAFEKIPFEEWLKGGRQARIQWSLRVFPARLSEHQRLETYVWATVNADEFMKRSERGQMELFMEVRDRNNRIYRSHRTLSLAKTLNPADLAAVKVVQHACVVPGDYEVAAAVYVTGSKEHNLKRTKLRVPELAHDPLPGAWRDLPSVEFSSCGPINSGRLSLPLQTEKPVRIEVVVNQTVNRDKRTGSGLAQGSSLLARLELLSEMEIRNGSMYVTVLDVERRKVNFTGKMDGRFLLRRLRVAMSKNDPYKIDVHALEGYREDAQFFVSEIRKRLESTESPEAERVLIVLSAPLVYPKEEDLRPIEATPGSRVFYVRCNPPLNAFFPPNLYGGPELGGAPPGSLTPPFPVPPASNRADSLARTLAPLHPRLYDVTTPLEFRHTLAAIMREISQQD